MKPEGSTKLTIVPCPMDEANLFVATHHRHHRPLTVGYVFAVACADESGAIRGVAIVGRPCARGSWDGWTLEVRRVATDGCPNACSVLYAAAWRVCRAMGYRRLMTYTLESEPGTSLRATQWRQVGVVKGKTWDRPERPRVDKHPLQNKICWEVKE